MAYARWSCSDWYIYWHTYKHDSGQPQLAIYFSVGLGTILPEDRVREMRATENWSELGDWHTQMTQDHIDELKDCINMWLEDLEQDRAETEEPPEG